MKTTLRLWLLVCVPALAGQAYAQQTCFEKFKHRGDSLLRNREWQMAIRQYQAAKHCDMLSYQNISGLDSMINATYARWIKESEAARKAVEQVALKTLLMESNELFEAENLEALKRRLRNSPFSRDTLVKECIEAVSPFFPDSVMHNVVGMESIFFEGKSQLLLLRKRTADADKSIPKDRSNIKSPKGLKGVGNIELGGGTEKLSLMEFVVLDPAARQLKELYSTSFPIARDDDSTYRLVKRGDSVFVGRKSRAATWVQLAYYYDPGTSRLKSIYSLGMDAPAASFSVLVQGLEFERLLKKYGLSGKIERERGRSLTLSRYSSIVLQQKNSSNAFSMAGVVSWSFLQDMDQLLLIVKPDSLTTFEAVFMALPDLAVVRTFRNLEKAPAMTYLKNTQLLQLKFSGEAGKQRCVDLLTNRELELAEDRPVDITDIRKRIDGGFLGVTGRVLKIFDQSLQVKKRIQLVTTADYRYLPLRNELLVIKDHNESTLDIPVEDTKARSQTDTTPVLDTLLVYCLSTGDSSTLQGEDLQFINDSCVAFLHKDTVELLDFPQGGRKRQLFMLTPVKGVEISESSGVVMIRYRDIRTTGPVFPCVTYSLKYRKEIIRTPGLLTTPDEVLFIGQTEKPRIQELFVIDTATHVLTRMLVKNIDRKDLVDKDVYFEGEKDLFYTETDIEAEDSDSDRESTWKKKMSTLVREKSHVLYQVFHAEHGKLKTVKVIGERYFRQILLAGNFIMVRNNQDIDNSISNECYFFRLRSSP